MNVSKDLKSSLISWSKWRNGSAIPMIISKKLTLSDDVAMSLHHWGLTWPGICARSGITSCMRQDFRFFDEKGRNHSTCQDRVYHSETNPIDDQFLEGGPIRFW